MSLTNDSLSRRQLLRLGVTTGIGLACSSLAVNAEAKDWRQMILDRDRWLSLERTSTREKANFLYYRYGQGFDLRGYNIACHLLRDVKSNATFRMDPKLIDLLFIIQAWLRINRLPYAIKIHSGYRTPEHNATLKRAARKSQHMLGKAADIEIPGLSTENLRKLARAIGVGGVGFYPVDRFVHVDTANIRQWTG